MKDVSDKNIEKAFAKNQYFLFRFSLNLIFVSSIVLFLYGLFGESLMNSLDFAEPVSEEIQKKNRKKRTAAIEEDWDRIENGIHVQTGLIYADGFDVVRGTCTACHSAKLVTQNRATREGWKDMIVWMQETQGLWDLGKSEAIILDYLAAHYAPEEIERRPGLDMAELEWYILELPEESLVEN